MKPKQIKQILLSEIKKVSDRADEFCLNPGKCFVRKRKLSFETVIRGIIGMESKSLTNELNLTIKVFHGFLYRVA